MRLLLLLAALIEGVPASAQKPAISVCELFKDLRSYDGKTISVRGLLYSSTEISALGDHCETAFSTKYSPLAPMLPGVPGALQYEYTWPTALDLALQKEDEKVNQVMERIRLERKRLGGVEKTDVWVTVVGKLSLKDHYDVGPSADGTLRGGGFGHLSAYPGQLVIQTMLDPVVERR